MCIDRKIQAGLGRDRPTFDSVDQGKRRFQANVATIGQLMDDALSRIELDKPSLKSVLPGREPFEAKMAARRCAGR